MRAKIIIIILLSRRIVVAQRGLAKVSVHDRRRRWFSPGRLRDFNEGERHRRNNANKLNDVNMIKYWILYFSSDKIYYAGTLRTVYNLWRIELDGNCARVIISFDNIMTIFYIGNYNIIIDPIKYYIVILILISRNFVFW